MLTLLLLLDACLNGFFSERRRKKKEVVVVFVRGLKWWGRGRVEEVDWYGTTTEHSLRKYFYLLVVSSLKTSPPQGQGDIKTGASDQVNAHHGVPSFPADEPYMDRYNTGAGVGDGRFVLEFFRMFIRT